MSTMAMDSVPELISQLSALHLSQALRNSAGVWSHEQKRIKQKKLKSIAFDTVFRYLKDHSIDHDDSNEVKLSAKEQLYARAFHLRSRRKFDDAQKLQSLVDSLCNDGKHHDTDIILQCLLCLQDSVETSTSRVIGHEHTFSHQANVCQLSKNIVLPQGPLVYGDTKLDICRSDSVMYFPRHVFEVNCDPNLGVAQTALLDSQVFLLRPGSQLHNISAFSHDASAGSCRTRRDASSRLFGGLVRSRVSSVNVQLDIPDLPDRADVVIPTFYKPISMEVSEDEGFVEAMPSSLSASTQSVAADAESHDIWTAAVHHKLDTHYTWEAVGRDVRDRERRYLSEAGCRAFDDVRRLYVAKRIQMVDPSVQRLSERVVSESDLVVDVCGVLIGLPSRSFRWSCHDSSPGRFSIAEGLYVSGKSPEAVQCLCHDILECATYYQRLSDFARPRQPSSLEEFGVVMEAFRSGLFRFLQHYRAFILAVPQSSLTLLRLNAMLRKVIVQMRYVTKLCRLDDHSLREQPQSPLPTGSKLLSLLYGECLNASSAACYPVLLSLLADAAAPYLCMVHEWIFFGQCCDSYGEFMLQMNHKFFARRDEQHWTHGYTPTAADIISAAPAFLCDVAKDIFLCGKSLSLLRLCSAGQHFVCDVSDRADVPPLRLLLNVAELSALNERFAAYFQLMRTTARRRMSSRSEMRLRAEGEKRDLAAHVHRTAVERLHKLQGEIVEANRKKDAKKRRELSELKAEMEREVKQKILARESELADDRALMAASQRQELLEARLDDRLMQQAKEELISYYKQLSDDVILRTTRAEWKVRRHRLDEQRVAWLRSSASLTSSADDVATEVYRPSGTSESDAGGVHADKSDSQLIGQTERDGMLPRWAAAAINSELPRSYYVGDRSDGRHSASDSMLSSQSLTSLPGWAARALAGKSVPLTNATSQSTIESQDETLPDNSEPAKSGTRATWGPVEAVVVRSRLTSVAGSDVGSESSEATENICAEDSSVHSDGKESSKVDRLGTQLFHGEVAGSLSDTSISRPAASEKFIRKTASLHDIDSKLAEKPQVSAACAPCDENDILFEDAPGSKMSEDISLYRKNKSAEQLRKLGAYQSVNQESTGSEEPRHVRPVDNQHVSNETVADDERHHVKLVPNQFVGSETTQVDDQTHLRMSSLGSATTESQEIPEHASVKSVDGQHISAETFDEHTVKPCVRVHAQHRAVDETESSLPSSYGFPAKREAGATGISEESSWAEFTHFQVCRTVIPRRKWVAGRSTAEETSEPSQFVPHIKLNAATNASTESEHVDVDSIRREKFRQHNVHGHSSDSSVARLLHGQSAAESAAEPDDDVIETGFSIDSLALVTKHHVEPYQDRFHQLDEPPAVDLLPSPLFSGTSDDARSQLISDENNPDLEVYKVTSLPVIIQRYITAPIRAQAAVLSDAVVNYFLVDLDIERHFVALRRYLLLQDGEYTLSLTDQLFNKLATHKQPSEFLNPAYLNSTLQRALSLSIHCNDPCTQNVGFVLRQMPKLLAQNAPDILDSLQITYKVDWPVNLVITGECLQLYSDIFSFMLQVKRCVWVLKEIFHRLKRVGVGVDTRCDSRQLRQLQLFRHEMQHFVRVLHEYIANEVVTVSWHEFETDLNRHLAGLGDLRQRHVNYLQRCLSRCLLDRQARPVMKIIRSIFSLILTFSGQLTSNGWERDVTAGDLHHPSFAELQRTYCTFHEHSLFLFKVVDQLATRGYQPHFDELLLRLNFSGYYKSQ